LAGVSDATSLAFMAGFDGGGFGCHGHEFMKPGTDQDLRQNSDNKKQILEGGKSGGRAETRHMWRIRGHRFRAVSAGSRAA
jgi:hypothetical protein